MPQASASKDAAAIAAAHRVLANYFPIQQANLDAQFASSLAAISDTPANISAGVAVEGQAAQALIAARFHDGLLANVPYVPSVGAGFCQRTPPAFAPPIATWLGQMVPFTMTSATQFFSDEGPTLGGPYEIDPDCAGRLLSPDGSVFAHLVVVHGGKEIFSLSLSPGNSVTEVLKKINKED